jgi:hypothetical protein
MADIAAQALQVQIKAMIGTWERERAERRSLRDSMATEGNHSYQDGYADALDRCVQALKLLEDTTAP